MSLQQLPLSFSEGVWQKNICQHVAYSLRLSLSFLWCDSTLLMDQQGSVCMQVDDLLEAAGVRLLGSEASHVVAFHHAEHQLHPLDLEAAGKTSCGRCLSQTLPRPGPLSPA